MTPVEIIALLFILSGLVKIAVILTKPGSWKGVVKKFYGKPVNTTVIALAVGAIILYFLLQEMTIVQIFAAMTFMGALMVVQFAAFGEELIELSDKFLDYKELLKKARLALVIWVVLMIWALVEIFR